MVAENLEEYLSCTVPPEEYGVLTQARLTRLEHQCQKKHPTYLGVTAGILSTLVPWSLLRSPGSLFKGQHIKFSLRALSLGSSKGAVTWKVPESHREIELSAFGKGVEGQPPLSLSQTAYNRGRQTLAREPHRLFGPLCVVLPQNTTSGHTRTVRLKLHSPCAELDILWKSRYFVEEPH